MLEFYKLNVEICRLQALLEDRLTENEAFYATELYNKMLDIIGDLRGIDGDKQIQIYEEAMKDVEHEREMYKDYIDITDGEKLAGKALGIEYNIG